jgi:hypothetical protein
MRELNNLSISREAAESRAKTRENEAAQLREECDKQRLKLTNQCEPLTLTQPSFAQ